MSEGIPGAEDLFENEEKVKALAELATKLKDYKAANTEKKAELRPALERFLKSQRSRIKDSRNFNGVHCCGRGYRA